MSDTLIEVHGTYRTPDGVPASGCVVLELVLPFPNTDDPRLVTQGPVLCHLDPTGMSFLDQHLLSSLILLPLLFLIGLLINGRIFPFEASEPLVLLAAFADLGIGLPYFLAWMVGAGAGTVISSTYEYGNTYIIVAGLLNMLVVLDAYDIAMGRK
jgi:hypothetical protein